MNGAVEVEERLPAWRWPYKFASLGPFVILAAAAWRLASHWDDIPARFPIHWSAGGTPNGWATRSFSGVYGFLLIGAAICLLLVLFGYATLHWAHSEHGAAGQTHRTATAWTLVGAEYFMAWVFANVAMLPLTGRPQRLLIGVIVIVPLLAAAALAAAWRSGPVTTPAPGATRSAGLGPWGPQAGASISGTPAVGGLGPAPIKRSHWVGGIFYYNPDDPAVLVLKRFGWGYTLNFANARAWWLLGAIGGVWLVIAVITAALRR